MLDWPRFLDGHGIDYAEYGRYHITRGYIGLNCPFCGDDTGYNLGISLRNGFWHCWREPVRGSHSGKAPYRLIERLLGVSREVARALVQAGETITANDRTTLDDINRMLGKVTQVSNTAAELKFPDSYYRLDYSLSSRKLFYPYLMGRGYSVQQADWLVHTFRLCYTMRGPDSYRVIIPVYFRDKLVTWTGRAIGDDELRYRTLSDKLESSIQTGLPQAVMNIKDTLFDFDRARYGGNTLVVTEGTFDAMRITFLGWRHAIRGVSLYGKQASPAQIDLLAELVPRYRRRVSLLDADTGLSGFAMFPEDFHIRQQDMPSGVKDPALLNREQFGQLFRYGVN